MHLPVGTLLGGGKYKIEKVLGQGGFGITYLAEQTSLGRKVALKEFFMEGLCNRDAATSHVSVPSVGSKKLVERFKQKFIKEARMIASFDNSHIISIHDVFEENGTAYYVMEYLGGKSLSAIVNEQGIMSETLAMKYIRQVADALAEVHANNLLHLDVKPANIMLNKKGEAVLIDFGISKHYDEAGNQTSSALIGTSEGYAPIEQYEAGALDSFTPATDIYALGATLFFLLTGTRPPKASEVMNYGLPELPSGVSASVRSTIETAMQPAIAKRPQSIAEFLCLVESGKMPDESDGETVLNGNEKAERRNEKEHSAGVVISNVGEKSHSDDAVILNASEKSHSANNEILPPYSRQNDKDGKEEVERRNEKEHSAAAVISNESEKSQKNKPGKSLWLILLLLLIAVAGTWFLFGGRVSGNTPKTDTKKQIVKKDTLTSPLGNQSETSETVSEEMTLIPILDSKTGKYGFVDKSGNEVIPCKYDYIRYFSEGLARVSINGKEGVIDKSGNEVIPCKYGNVSDFSEGLACVELNGKYGFIDKSGNEVIPCKYDDSRPFSEGLAIVILNGKWVFIDKSGNEVTLCKYDKVSDFSEGLAFVSMNGKLGFIDKSGNEVIPCKYDEVFDFSEGLAAVNLNDKWGFIDKSGNEVIPCKYDYVRSFSEGLAAVNLNGKRGFIDKSGNEVIPCEYDEVLSFSEGLAAVNLNDIWGYINKSGNEVIPCKYDEVFDFSEGLAAVYLNGKWGYIDKSGNEVIPCKYDDVSWRSFSENEGLVAVSIGDLDNGKWGYIDKSGNEVIPCEYDNVWSFYEGLARVRMNGKYGFIDKAGKLVIPPKYDDVEDDFSGGLAYVKLNGKYFYIDKTGKEYIK